MTKRFTVTAVFLVGLLAGCAIAPLVVPKASAQQAATLTKWEYKCVDAEKYGTDATNTANQLGAQSWEMVTQSQLTTCFKRPKM